MRRRIQKWLIELFNPIYTRPQKAKINAFKSMFEIFFEGGFEWCQLYETRIPIEHFRITDFLFKFNSKNKLTVTIVLSRPGMLIGKGGRTIDALNEYLKSNDIVATIEESKLWKRYRIES